MFGAILGDIIGSPYEFDCNNIRTTDFPLFCEHSGFTDDSVMTLAVADGFMHSACDSDEKIKESIIRSMRRLGKAFPYAGYGGMFSRWLVSDHPAPYGSYGNGSAMRVSSAAWIFDTMEDVRRGARLSAEVTHNHPEGIKGAEAVAAAIFLARTGSSKAEIRRYIEAEFGYDLSRSCDDIRPDYHHVETCQETVPEAFAAFFEGGSFEEVIRLAVSLGGDSDTLAAIAGSIAEGFYSVDSEMRQEAYNRLPEELAQILQNFEVRYCRTNDKEPDYIRKAINLTLKAYTRHNCDDTLRCAHFMDVLRIMTDIGASIHMRLAAIVHEAVDIGFIPLCQVERELTPKAALFAQRMAQVRHAVKAGLDPEFREENRGERELKLLLLADMISELNELSICPLPMRYRDESGDSMDELSLYYSRMQDALWDMQHDCCSGMYWQMVGLYKDVFVSYHLCEEDYIIYQTARGAGTYAYSPLKDSWEDHCGVIPEDAAELSREQAESLEDLWRGMIHDPRLKGNDLIKDGLDILFDSSDYHSSLCALLQRIDRRADAGGCMLMPEGMFDRTGEYIAASDAVVLNVSGRRCLPVYTGYDAVNEKLWCKMDAVPIRLLINTAAENIALDGIMINPGDYDFFIEKDFLVPFAESTQA